MKRWYLLIASFVMAFFMFVPCTSQAQATYVNGVPCWNGDLNYPYIEQGSHAGTVVDVSSSYISENNDEYVEVKMTGYAGKYDLDYLMDQRITILRYYKKSHQYLLGRDDGSFYKPFVTSVVNNAFYLIRNHLGI